MTPLGKKLTANKAIKAILEQSETALSQEDAARLNIHFAVFGESFVLKPDANGRYDAEKAIKNAERCQEIVKKEYSARFMASLATMQMFQEED